MSTEAIDGQFQPHVAYVRPPTTEQPYNDAGTVDEPEPLGYATPDAYDETLTDYQDPAADLIPYPVYIVEFDKTVDKVRKHSMATYTLSTSPMPIVSRYSKDRSVFIRNTSDTDVDGYLTEGEYPSTALGFKLKAGDDISLTTTEPIFAWALVEAVTFSVVQEHDVEV